MTLLPSNSATRRHAIDFSKTRWTLSKDATFRTSRKSPTQRFRLAAEGFSSFDCRLTAKDAKAGPSMHSLDPELRALPLVHHRSRATNDQAQTGQWKRRVQWLSPSHPQALSTAFARAACVPSW